MNKKGNNSSTPAPRKRKMGSTTPPKPRKKSKKKSGEGKGNSISQSPSKTTVYQPLLNMAPQEVSSGDRVDKTARMVTEFLNKVRLSSSVNQPSISGKTKATERTEDKTPQELAREYVENSITQAEKFKATLAVPPEGIPDSLFAPRLTRGHDDDDDNFFHMTCHVELNLREVIERGGFVELDKLLPKALKHVKPYHEQKLLSAVNHDSQSYFVPLVDKEYRITGIRKWDQAFRIYASIFAEANPSRAVEIMQYLHTINDAASKWCWENVAQYDYIFRQKMSQKPYKSWAKTYTQLWTSTMVNPLAKTPTTTHNSNSTQSSNTGKKAWREIACWRYNKGKCTRGAECKFEHRCSYCGSGNHVYPNCLKRKKKTPSEDTRRVTVSSN